MPSLDELEQAYEAKFAHDEEMRFRMIVRRNRLFADWVAGQMHLAGADAETYVGSIGDLVFHPGGQHALPDRAIADLAESGSRLAPPEVRAAFAYFEAVAKREILTGTGPAR